jgi:NAD(P)-dependent dehydrogenase (short-subunit alcohol dehydrogenase family)
MRVRDKVCLVSGGARGLGAAQARLLAAEGGKVVVGDVLQTEGWELEAEIAESGGQALFVRLDVTDEDDWKRAVDESVSRFGALDVLVNNAGIFHRATLANTTRADWDRVMEVNSTGVFLGSRTVIPVMKESGGGSIVNVSSISGLIGSTGSTAYNASKGAVRLLTKATALQHAADGIRVNSVHPGPMETDMLGLVFVDADAKEDRRGLIPAGRFGRPEDVAYGVLFLASDESSYMTGSELVIDGGYTAQ